MFKLKSLTLKNFMAFEKAHIDFKKPGLYIITGFNEVGGDSNGAGKSCILSAICYALWGKTESGLKKDQITRWDMTNHSVILELDGPQGVYKIERTLDFTKLYINNKQILPEAWRKKEIQETINETFHSDPKIFFSATMFDRNLADMGDAGKKDLLKGILNLEAIDTAYQKIRIKLDQLGQKASSLAIEKEMIELDIPNLKKKVERYEDLSESFTETRQRKIDDINAELSTPLIYDVNLAQTLKYHQNKEETLKKESNKREELSTSIITDINSIKEAIAKSQGKINVKQDDLKGILENSKFPKCKLCGGDIQKPLVDKLKADIIKAVQDEMRIITALSTKLEKLEDSLSSITLNEKDLEETRKKVNEIRVQFISMETSVEAWENTKKRLLKSLDDIWKEENTYEELKNQTMQELELRNLKLDDIRTAFGIVTKDIDIYSFLKWVFSREGVASYIIEKSFSSLQTLANHYLSKVCKERFQIHISPQRELRNKTLKEEIDISILQGSRKIAYEALSGGQKQRINIALVVSLYKLCKNMKINMFDFLLLDEVLDLSLADKGQEDMVSLLRLLLSEISQVIVISHKEGISKDFDYEIKVRRDLKGVASVN